MKDFKKIDSKPGVYAIINTQTKRLYVGSSKNVRGRLREHFRNLKENKHSNLRLQISFNKDGEEVFQFRVLEFVVDLKDLINIEEKWIWYFKDANRKLYNRVFYPTKTTLGFRHTEEWKQKHSGEKSPMWGKHHTEESKRKISEANKGIKKDPKIYKSKEFREKISKVTKGNLNGNFGKYWSKEKRKKQSDYFHKNRCYCGDKNPNVKLKSDDFAKVVELYESGSTMKELANIFNVCQNTMTSYFQKMGIRKRTMSNRINESQVQKVEKMWADGYTKKRIAKEFGVSQNTITDFFKKYIPSQVGVR